MDETRQPEQPDKDPRDTPPEQAGEGSSDARDRARESAERDAAREGHVREGEERRATGNPAAAGED
jgi:hypothetical protein